MRALGVNAQLLLGWETTYGTAATGNYVKLPFVSADYGAEQKLLADDTIGHGREPIDPGQDVIDVNHNLDIPVDIANIGVWLKGLFGAPTTTGDAAPYTHTYQSGSPTLPSASIELGLTDVTEYFLTLGALVNSLKLDWKPSGLVGATINVIAQNETFSGATSGGTPTANAYRRVSSFQGAITLAGEAVAGITEADLTYDNKAEGARVIRPDGLVEGVDPLMVDCSGKLTALFEDATLFTDALAFTPLSVTLGWTLDANTSLVFTMPRVFLPRPKATVKGPGGISASFDYQAAHDADAGYLVQAVLKNTIAAY